MKRHSKTSVIVVVLISVVAVMGAFLTLSGVFTEKTDMPLGLGVQEVGKPVMFENYLVNVTVVDGQERPMKNVWVVVMHDTVAEVYGYTDEQGTISFNVSAGYYTILFEKYQYTAEPMLLMVDTDKAVVQTMQFEEMMVFGMVPSWALMLLVGLILLGLTFWNRASLGIRGWGRPENWFGSSPDGSWTFLEKSTKNVLYGMTGLLLVFLLVFILPNFPTFRDMAIYYVAIGFIILVLFLIEGKDRKSWVAAIGFGRVDELAGNILIGLSFALMFLGITGFYSQFSILGIGTGTLISILMVVLVASFFEEAFFSGIVAPTIAEKTGILSSIVVTSVFFMVAHGLAYGWVVVPLMNAFFFRTFATVIVLHRKSWISIFIAHVVINVLSVFSVMLFL